MNTENAWISIDRELPMCTVDDYFAGGKQVIVTDGKTSWYCTVGDPNTWEVYARAEGVTHWKPHNGKLTVSQIGIMAYPPVENSGIIASNGLSSPEFEVKI